MRFCARTCALVTLATLLSGCGGADMAAVKGRVLFRGQPVPEASLTFSPIPKSDVDKEPGKPGTGFTDEKGQYVLSSYKPFDGALIGNHRVVVMVDDTNPVRCKRLTQIELEVKSGENDLDIELE